MTPETRQKFLQFTVDHEGYVETLYLDLKGLPSIAIGNYIATADAASKLPFVYRNTGAPATPDAIRVEWQTINSLQWMKGKSWKQFAPACKLKLTREGAMKLVGDSIDADEKAIRIFFPAWDSFPENVQLAIMSMAWAHGPFFSPKWPNFTKAANARDWKTCAVQCVPNAKEMALQNDSFHKRVAQEVAWFSSQ